MIRCSLSVAIVLYAAIARANTLPAPHVADPAAALCVKDGAKVDIETAENGNRHAVCAFPSGSRIEEWAYFRNKHRTQR